MGAREAWEHVGLLLAAGVLVLFRLHAWNLPLEADECNYAYIGARLLEGQRLYVDLWDHQPWGVFALVAGVIALFGDEPGVFRALSMAFSLGSLILVHAVTRRMAGARAGLTGAVIFALVSSDPGTAGEGCNREIYMNTLILLAWYAALRWESGEKSKANLARDGAWLLLAGTALGLASAIKTVVAVHWLALGVWIAGVGLDRSRPDARGNTEVDSRSAAVIGAVLLLAMGPLAIWLATGGYFAFTGRWAEFVDAVFTFNLSYSGENSGFVERLSTFFRPRHPFTFQSARPIWVGLVIGVLWLAIEGVTHRRRENAAVLLLAGASFVAVCLPGKFWPHYYYLMIPAGAIAAGLISDRLVLLARSALERMSRWCRLLAPALYALLLARAFRLVTLAAGVVLPALLPAWAFHSQYNNYLSQSLYGITFKRYNSKDFWGRAQGENVARATSPDDKVFVFNNDACIYYYADRRCASRFTMATGLDVRHPGAAQRWKTLLAELRADPPRLVFLLFDYSPGPGWVEFLREHYTDPIGADQGDYHGEIIMLVLARKDSDFASASAIDWNWHRSSVGGW